MTSEYVETLKQQAIATLAEAIGSSEREVLQNLNSARALRALIEMRLRSPQPKSQREEFR